MYLVDTNVISDARRKIPQALSWLQSVPPDEVFLSVVTLGEIARGIAQKQRTDPRAAQVFERWLARLRTTHRARILPITDVIAIEWGRLAAERPRGDVDGLIAATAIAHGLTVVTRNVRDFADTGVPCINPWEA
jgi:toxin FitB